MQAFLNLSTNAANENPSYERSLRVVRDREIFSARPVVTYMRAMLFELVEACECRRSPKSAEESNSGHILSCPQMSSADLLVMHWFKASCSLGRGSFQFGKIFLTKSIMTWRVIPGYGTSCAWTPQKVVGEAIRMVSQVPFGEANATSFSGAQKSERLVVAEGTRSRSRVGAI